MNEKKSELKNKQSLASNGLVSAVITREKVAEKGMTFETEVFEESLQRFVSLVEGEGADPIEVLEESKRLLEKGIDRLKKSS